MALVDEINPQLFVPGLHRACTMLGRTSQASNHQDFDLVIWYRQIWNVTRKNVGRLILVDLLIDTLGKLSVISQKLTKSCKDGVFNLLVSMAWHHIINSNTPAAFLSSADWVRKFIARVFQAPLDPLDQDLQVASLQKSKKKSGKNMFPNIPKPTYNEPCFFGIEGLAFISCIAVSSKVPLQTQQKKNAHLGNVRCQTRLQFRPQMLCQLHQWILAAKDWTVMTVTT